MQKIIEDYELVYSHFSPLIHIRKGKQFLRYENKRPIGFQDEACAKQYAEEHKKQQLKFNEVVPDWR